MPTRWDVVQWGFDHPVVVALSTAAVVAVFLIVRHR
jgi:hypothetical protein